MRWSANDSIESLFYIPSGDCYNAGTEFIENVISILLRSSTNNPESLKPELDTIFYQECQAAVSLDEEQITSQANEVLLSRPESLSSPSSALATPPSPDISPIITDNVPNTPTTTSGNNDQRKNLTIASDILNNNRVTKVFSSTILMTTSPLATESSG